jgi:hypothetical protein
MSLEQAIYENTAAMLTLTELMRGLSASGLKPIAIDENTVWPEAVRAPLSEIAPLFNEVPVNNPAPEPQTTLTADSVRDTFIAFAQVHGRTGQLAALAEFGVAKLGELDSSKFADMVTYLAAYGASNE